MVYELVAVCLRHHLNMFMSHYIYYPQGFDLAWATAEPAVALAMAPVTWTLGAQASYNLVALLSPALAAAAAFYLIRIITRQYWPALVGGFIYGFSSYELGQLLGHPNLYVTFLLPLLILVFWLRLQGRLGRWQFMVLAAVLAALQFATSIEIFTAFAVFAVLAWAVFWWFSAADVRRRLWATALETAMAGAGMLVLVSPYLYYLLPYYHTVPHILNPPEMFSADLFNFIIPTGVTRWSSAVWPVAYHFVGGNWSEAGSYLGWPLILMLVIFTVQYWKKPYVKALAVTLVGLAVASLGPHIAHLRRQAAHQAALDHGRAFAVYPVGVAGPVLTVRGAGGGRDGGVVAGCSAAPGGAGLPNTRWWRWRLPACGPIRACIRGEHR